MVPNRETGVAHEVAVSGRDHVRGTGSIGAIKTGNVAEVGTEANEAEAGIEINGVAARTSIAEAGVVTDHIADLVHDHVTGAVEKGALPAGLLPGSGREQLADLVAIHPQPN